MKDIPKTAVIGASGFLGFAFLQAYRRIYPDCAGTVRKAQGKNIFALDLLKPDIKDFDLAKNGHKEALILAGITKISECERNKDFSRKINVKGTLELIRQLAGEGIKAIFASSDYVFDGRTGGYLDDSPVNPTTEYGCQKRDVEAEIDRASEGNYLVVRLSKVFSLKKEDNTLLDEIAAILLSGKTVRAAYDQVFSPTLISDAINAVINLQLCATTGIVNVCSPEAWSRYELALEVAKALGVDARRILRISLDEIEFGHIRPKNTSMQIKRLLRETDSTFTPVSECIEKIKENWKKHSDGTKDSLRERSLAGR